ncbi:MAG TPA: VWA domain-containing protein [Trebonia sp.]
MTFDHPALLAVGLLVAGGLAWAAATIGRRRAAALASAGVAPAGARRAGRGGWARNSGIWLTVAGIAALGFAGAGPSVTVPVSHANGTVIIAMDVSGSMTATDVAPSRLSAAKTAAQAFINAQPGSVQIGVVAFEQGGLEAAVPSTDHATALAAVRRLTTGGGTSLGSAILAALSVITHRTVALDPFGNPPDIGNWPSATIVMFSDGQDGGAALTAGDGTGNASTGAAAGGSAAVTSAAAALAERAEVHVDTVGVGTAAGTTVIADGYHLFTALDAGTLKSIAQATGGTYHPASNASELNGIASSINLRLTVSNQPLPLAGAVIALALLLITAGAMLTLMRTGRVI